MKAVGSGATARTTSGAAATAERPPAAADRARCSSIRRANSSSPENGTPRSAASSRVSSIGKPNVSCRRKASSGRQLAVGEQVVVEQARALLERAAEALLLGAHPLEDRRGGSTARGTPAPIVSITCSTNRGRKPGSIPIRWPCWIARRMTRRRM